MGYGNLNLGELATALRMSGGAADPELLERLRLEEEMRRQQTGPALPQQTQGALERSGSSYRLPEAQQEPPREPAPNPYGTAVRDRDFNPRTSNRQLQDEYALAQNESLALAERKGQIESGGFDRQAGEAEKLATTRSEGLAAVRARVDQNRTQKQMLEREAMGRLYEIQSLVDNPPDQSKGKVMNIIATMLSATDRGRAVGSGLAMLGQSMGSDVDAWKREIAGNKEVYNALMQAAAHESADSEHEVRLEDGLEDLAVGVYSASIEKIKAETNSEEAKRAADELQNGLRAKYVEGQLQKNAAAAKGAGASQKKAIDRILEGMPMEQLRAFNESAQGDGHSRAIYESRLKGQTAQLDHDKKKRELEGGGSEEEILPGFVSTIELSPSSKTDIVKNARAVQSVIEDLGKLRAIRERNKGGSFNANDEQEAQRIKSGMSTKMSQLNGAGAPSEGEREMFLNDVPDPTGYYLRKDPTELYDRMARDLRSNFESGLKAIGVEKRGGSRGLGFKADEPSEAEDENQRAPVLRRSDRLLTRGNSGR